MWKTGNTQSTVFFTNDKCWMQGLSMRRPLLLGNLLGGLYILETSSSISKSTLEVLLSSNKHPSTCNTTFMSKHTEAKLWHIRLGHSPFPNMKFVKPSLDGNGVQRDVFCTICPQARQTRLPFPSSTIKTTSPFKLIHVDVWGPYSSPTYDGCNYFLTIVDDYTWCTWVFFYEV